MKTSLETLAFLCSLLFLNVAEAHPGRTDASGGHHDRRSGGYHYHGGGSSSSSGLRTTPRVTAPSISRLTARTAVRTVAKTSPPVVQTQPAKPSAESELAKAKFAFEGAVAGLERIVAEYPRTDAARQAQQLLLSHCQNERAAVDANEEREAGSKLRLAKSLLDRGKRSDGIRWLKEVVAEYGDTKAGKEAAQRLQSMGE